MRKICAPKRVFAAPAEVAELKSLWNRISSPKSLPEQQVLPVEESEKFCAHKLKLLSAGRASERASERTRREGREKEAAREREREQLIARAASKAWRTQQFEPDDRTKLAGRPVGAKWPGDKILQVALGARGNLSRLERAACSIVLTSQRSAAAAAA